MHGGGLSWMLWGWGTAPASWPCRCLELSPSPPPNIISQLLGPPAAARGLCPSTRTVHGSRSAAQCKPQPARAWRANSLGRVLEGRTENITQFVKKERYWSAQSMLQVGNAACQRDRTLERLLSPCHEPRVLEGIVHRNQALWSRQGSTKKKKKNKT